MKYVGCMNCKLTRDTVFRCFSFQLSFSMRTEQPTGMIWVWANYKNFTRYFYLNLVDGYPVIEVRLKTCTVFRQNSLAHDAIRCYSGERKTSRTQDSKK